LSRRDSTLSNCLDVRQSRFPAGVDALRPPLCGAHQFLQTKEQRHPLCNGFTRCSLHEDKVVCTGFAGKWTSTPALRTSNRFKGVQANGWVQSEDFVE
jgi:hypothetical protein